MRILRPLPRWGLLALILVAACDVDEFLGPRRLVPGSGTDATGQGSDSTRSQTGSGQGTRAFTFETLRTGAFAGVLHCGGPLQVRSEYEEYVAAFPATRPAMFVTYYSLVSSRFTPAQKLDVLRDELRTYATGISFLGVSYTAAVSPTEGRGYDREVAAGQFDAEIREIGRILAAQNRPVFFRPGFEFNGVWNNYSPQYYAASFRRFVNLFREVGARTVIYVWNYHPAGNTAPYMAFYPGDDVVDWWGVNLFGGAFSREERTRVEEFVASAKSRRKPLIIPESVPHKLNINDPGTWDAWFVPYFRLIHNGFGAFCYSNRDYTQVPAWKDWGDLRIEKSALRPKWAAELAKEQYLHLK